MFAWMSTWNIIFLSFIPSQLLHFSSAAVNTFLACLYVCSSSICHYNFTTVLPSHTSPNVCVCMCVCVHYTMPTNKKNMDKKKLFTKEFLQHFLR